MAKSWEVRVGGSPHGRARNCKKSREAQFHRCCCINGPGFKRVRRLHHLNQQWHTLRCPT
eukprot:501446-Alexandrium_andersonii.AAC.1